jgi:hypothetical protein
MLLQSLRTRLTALASLPLRGLAPPAAKKSGRDKGELLGHLILASASNMALPDQHGIFRLT